MDLNFLLVKIMLFYVLETMKVFYQLNFLKKCLKKMEKFCFFVNMKFWLELIKIKLMFLMLIIKFLILNGILKMLKN